MNKISADVSCLSKFAPLLIMVAALGCGMRGAPLAPLVFVPDAVTSFEARRLDNEVHIRFDVPSANTDGTSPADLERVEVYAVTTQPDVTRPSAFVLEEWLGSATLIESLVIDNSTGESSDGPPEAVTGMGHAQQGQEVTFIEVLTPDVRVPVPVATNLSEEGADDDQLESADASVGAPLVSPPLPVPPRRTYLALAVSTRGRESAASRRVAVTLGSPTSAPGLPDVTYTESEFLLEWSAPPSARLPVQEPPTDGVLASRPIVELWAATTYTVYAVQSDATVDAPERPTPLNAAPITGTSYLDTGVTFDVRRCYVVRALDTIDSLEVEGPVSAPACVVPVDTFAPQAPLGLVAVASADAISLVWDPGSEPDISGYLVLRGTAPGATLDRLTPEPIEETTFRDANLETGQLYVYAVQAVDNATPPNASPPSVEVTERVR